MLELQQNLARALKQRMENLFSTSSIYFKTQKDTLLNPDKSRLNEIAAFRIPVLKQQIKKSISSNKQTSAVDIKVLNARHVSQIRKGECVS